MTTYDLSIGTGSPKALNAPGVHRQVKVIDFRDTPYASADLLKLFYVPINTTVWCAGYRLLRKEGATSAVHLMGYTADTDAFLTSIDANATVGASQNSLAAGAAKQYGFHFTAADYVNFTLAAAIATAKIVFFAWFLDVGMDFSTET